MNFIDPANYLLYSLNQYFQGMLLNILFLLHFIFSMYLSSLLYQYLKHNPLMYLPLTIYSSKYFLYLNIFIKLGHLTV